MKFILTLAVALLGFAGTLAWAAPQAPAVHERPAAEAPRNDAVPPASDVVRPTRSPRPPGRPVQRPRFVAPPADQAPVHCACIRPGHQA